MSNKKKQRSKSLIEESKTLSKSILWTLQEQAYKDFGPEAWSKKGVPFYLTSNPYTISQYIAITVAYLQDCLKNNLIDFNYPLYLFDLGAGSGRFGYLYLTKLLQVLSDFFSEKLSICYVMTDISEKNIQFLQNHSLLKPFINEQQLDFSFYTHNQLKPIYLIETQTEISSTKNPIVLIGNYFFDTIPQDFFKIENGIVKEAKVSLYSDHVLPSVDSPEIINHLQSKTEFSELENCHTFYKENTQHQELLTSYLSEEQKNLPFGFPIGAFASIDYFKKLSKNRMLIISGDQGTATIAQMQKLEEPRIDKHGTFSMPVNYHAIQRFIERNGGLSLLPMNSNPQFIVMAAISDGKKGDYLNTLYAFEQTIATFSPCDYWKLIEELEKSTISPPLSLLLQLLKFGKWDLVNFFTFFERIRKEIPNATQAEKKELLFAIHSCAKQFYFVSQEEVELILNFGVLCFDLEEYEISMQYFQKCFSLGCKSQSLLNNIALCKEKLKKPSK